MKKLLITILILATAVFTVGAADYNIMKYGAKADTTVLSTKALQRAINACAKAGGGRVVVPEGSYKTGSIVMKSNVELHLERGATLYGSTRLEDYRPMKSDYVSLRTQTTTIQLIYADGVKHVTISGEGTIDGRGRAFKKQTWNDEGITRPHLIRFIQSEDITVRDITLRNSGCWMQHYLACDRLMVDGIKVVNRNNYNNDALDVDGCHDVVVRNVTADSDDDGITLKSTSPRLCENVHISNCVLSSHCNAVKLGTETNGGFRNIIIENITVRPSADQQEKFFGQWRGSSAVSLEIVDGGVMENVTVRNFKVEGTESPIFIRLGNRGRGYQFKKGERKELSGKGNDDIIGSLIPIDHVGSIRGIYLNNFDISGAGIMGCSVTGLPDHPVEDVLLANITLRHRGGVKPEEQAAISAALADEKEREYPEATMWGNLPAKGIYVRHARRLRLENVRVATDEPDARPDFVREDTDDDAPQWGDLGNGRFANPVLNADFSDPDVIRVGAKYYMVASDFHFLGMQVLESDDMVNWRYVSQIYSRFNEPGWDDNQHYAGGSWAPAIRYHEGRYYVYFCTPDEGLYMSSATDVCGPWSPLHLVKRIEKWEDPCPLWDDDGQAYLGRSRHGAGPIIVHKMSPDGRELLDEGVTVYTGPVAEGTKWLKRDGYYYLIIPEGGVGQGWQTVLRSRNIYGPYERRVVLEQGVTPVNGPHQGALVDTPDSTWWFYHFQETPVLGRVVHLQPARWEDGWPLMGIDIDGNGVGEPVSAWQKPIAGIAPTARLQTDDDFDGPALGLQWQWNHNPRNDYWSLNKREGWLTLEALPADSLKASHNMLTQKVVGYRSRSTTHLTITDSCRAGLFCIGKQFRGVGLCPEGVYVEHGGTMTVVKPGTFDELYLRVENDCVANRHQFFFSTDGVTFETAGESFPMRAGYWKGIRVGLFCYGDKGMAQFDYFKNQENQE